MALSRWPCSPQSRLLRQVQVSVPGRVGSHQSLGRAPRCPPKRPNPTFGPSRPDNSTSKSPHWHLNLAPQARQNKKEGGVPGLTPGLSLERLLLGPWSCSAFSGDLSFAWCFGPFRLLKGLSLQNRSKGNLSSQRNLGVLKIPAETKWPPWAAV